MIEIANYDIELAVMKICKLHKMAEGRRRREDACIRMASTGMASTRMTSSRMASTYT